MKRDAIIEAFGMPLYHSTIWFLERRGITNFRGLCTLSDRDRSLLPGWGKVREAKFLELRASNITHRR